mmetsp:Transcript_18638/g.53418  ORF Transcript_18638/g.53418 Transcript_18638/m.53418 type:complete len:582 (-) Transcript_18638:16-1761(-)
MVQLVVHNIGGDTLELSLESTQALAELKEEVARRWHFPPPSQSLFLESVPLHDDASPLGALLGDGSGSDSGAAVVSLTLLVSLERICDDIRSRLRSTRTGGLKALSELAARSDCADDNGAGCRCGGAGSAMWSNALDLLRGASSDSLCAAIEAMRAATTPGDPFAVAALVGCLDDPHARTRCMAAEGLGDLATQASDADDAGGAMTKALGALCALLGDALPLVRCAAAAALARAMPKRGAEDPLAALAARLGDSDAAVRKAVEAALVKLAGEGRQNAISAVLARLTDDDARIRHRAVTVIGRAAAAADGACAFQALQDSLDDQDVAVRLEALSALAAIAAAQVGPGAETAVAAISRRALSDDEDHVRATAIALLGELASGPCGEGALGTIARQAMRDCLADFGAMSVDTLRRAVRALGAVVRRGGDWAAELLLGLLQASDGCDVVARCEALSALADFVSSTAVDSVAVSNVASSVVISALRDDDACVRRAAVLAVSKLGGFVWEETMYSLGERLEDDDPRVRCAAASAIARLAPRNDEKAMAAAAARLHHSDACVRRAAADALTSVADTEHWWGVVQAFGE